MPNRTAWQQKDAGDLRRRITVYGLLAVALVVVVLLDNARDHGARWVDWVVLPCLLLLIWMLFGPWSFFARWNGTNAEVLKATPVPPERCSGLQNSLEGLAARTGTGCARLYVVESHGVNAILNGDGFILTRGLLDLLDEDEMRSVLAWLYTLRSGDVAGPLFAVAPESGYRAWDADALRILGEPASMLSAWRKILTSDNRVRGAFRLPQCELLVPPRLSESARRERLQELQDMAGAAGVE